jgi:hypothetical protein
MKPVHPEAKHGKARGVDADAETHVQHLLELTEDKAAPDDGIDIRDDDDRRMLGDRYLQGRQQGKPGEEV